MPGPRQPLPAPGLCLQREPMLAKAGRNQSRKRKQFPNANICRALKSLTLSDAVNGVRLLTPAKQAFTRWESPMERVSTEGRTGRTDPGASSAMAVPEPRAACALPAAVVIWGGQVPGGCPGCRVTPTAVLAYWCKS